jgi:hypothetical protein
MPRSIPVLATFLAVGLSACGGNSLTAGGDKALAQGAGNGAGKGAGKGGAKNCGAVALAGSLANKPSVCANRKKVQVRVTGDLGDTGKVQVTGPGGYNVAADLERKGEACNYGFAWEPAGVGEYTLAFSGTSGQSLNAKVNVVAAACDDDDDLDVD